LLSYPTNYSRLKLIVAENITPLSYTGEAFLTFFFFKPAAFPTF